MNDDEIQIENAIIESADISLSRGFILDCWVFLDYGGSAQGFGGYVLGGTQGKAGEHDKQPNIAAEFICSVLRVAEVENFSDLKGKCVRVRKSGHLGKILAIGHITKDIWFEPETKIQDMMNSCHDEREETDA